MATDRMEMSLDDVLKKDWKPPTGGGEAKAAPRAPRGKVAAFGKAVLGRTKGAKGSARGSAKGSAKGAKGSAKGRGLVRRNPAMLKVRRVPVKGASKGKGKTRWVPKGDVFRDDRQSRGKGKGRAEGGKSRGKGKSTGKSFGKSTGKSAGFGIRLWRGARPTNADTREAPKGKSRGKGLGKGLGKGKSSGKSKSRDLLRVNRNPAFLKRSTKGSKGQSKGQSKGKKGGGKTSAISTYSGKGQGSYDRKGKSKGKGYNDDRYSGGRNGGSYGNGSYGGSYSGGGSWGQDDNYYKGKGREAATLRASDQLTQEDKRMMKKITVVAQLDKVPKPHPAMQGLRKRSTGGDTGSLSSRFAANFRR